MGRIDKYIQVESNKVVPERGKLLLSEPLMGDFYFGRAVVLLAEHNEEGSFGVILNKPLKEEFNQVVPNFPEFSGKLHIGGPVERDSLFYVHSYGDIIEESIPIGGGLYWGGQVDMVKELILFNKLTPQNICFFVGYSGWSPSQLDVELKNNAWLVAPMPKLNLLAIKRNTMWDDMVSVQGEQYQYWSKFPRDPIMN